MATASPLVSKFSRLLALNFNEGVLKRELTTEELAQQQSLRKELINFLWDHDPNRPYGDLRDYLSILSDDFETALRRKDLFLEERGRALHTDQPLDEMEKTYMDHNTWQEHAYGIEDTEHE
jgi:hypothetical protein